MDLVLDSSGVHYSTPLEQFETSLLNIFDKGILATHSVPQLEKVPTAAVVGHRASSAMTASASLSHRVLPQVSAIKLYHGCSPI